MKGWTQDKCVMEKFVDGDAYPMIAPAIAQGVEEVPACLQEGKGGEGGMGERKEGINGESLYPC